MSEQYKPNIGELCKDDARRDAIHFAVAPVIARQDLERSDHVGIDERGTAFCVEIGDSRAVGIVDPFLTQVVPKGERFWLFLYPNTITNLRHVWEHPAFKAKLPSVKE